MNASPAVARALGLAVSLLSALLALSTLGAGAAAAVPESPVTRTPVEFDIVNVNRSRLPCRADGADYQVRGEIVATADLLDRAGEHTGTLYLHEFSFGRFFWRFDHPGYDYTEALARSGHLSVVIDRLGYDASDHPPGDQVCLGAQADVAAQIVRHLRDGTYRAADAPAPRLSRLVLAGHSVGAGIAELAAHSFPDLDVAGLMLFGWADQGYSRRALEQSLAQGSDCAGGGEPAEPGEPPGYAYFGRTDEDFETNVFHDADPVVVAAATALRNRDPCGDNQTLARMAAVNAAGVGELTVPVLLLSGDEDAVFDDGAVERQAVLFTSSPDVTVRRFPATGHALTLERAAGSVQAAAAEWLDEQGLDGGRADAEPPLAPPGGSRPHPQAEPRVLPRTGGPPPGWVGLLALAVLGGLRTARGPASVRRGRGRPAAGRASPRR